MGAHIQILSSLVLLCLSILLGVSALMFWKKSKVESSVSIQCSSGDSEVMIFNYNFKTGESEDSKQSKLSEAFEYIQDRRDENHEKFLSIQATEMEKNEARLANGEKLTMPKNGQA